MGRGSGNHNRVNNIIGSLIMDLLMCCMMCRCCTSVPFIYLYITMEMMEGKLKMVNSWTLGGYHIPRNSQEWAMFSFPSISCCVLYAVICAQILMYSHILKNFSTAPLCPLHSQKMHQESTVLITNASHTWAHTASLFSNSTLMVGTTRPNLHYCPRRYSLMITGAMGAVRVNR